MINYGNQRKGCKDVWGAYMTKGAKYTINDIPICPTVLSVLPKQLISWSDAKSLYKKSRSENKDFSCDAFIHFYIDDCKFDGPRSSVWFFPWMALRVLKRYRGIITPDFSTYQDFPYPLKLWNTFRMRAFGYWAGRQGLEVVNNVRWGTPETYHYCFDGIEKDSVVAIGTAGGSPRKLVDRKRFEKGLCEMVKRLSPHTIIICGSANYACFDKLKEKGIEIISFKSSTASYYEGRRGK